MELPSRDHVELSRAEHNVLLLKLNRERTREDDKELVGIGMTVPAELTGCPDHAHVVVVHRRDGPWSPAVVEGREGRGEIDGHSHAGTITPKKNARTNPGKGFHCGARARFTWSNRS